MLEEISNSNISLILPLCKRNFYINIAQRKKKYIDTGYATYNVNVMTTSFSF